MIKNVWFMKLIYEDNFSTIESFTIFPKYSVNFLGSFLMLGHFLISGISGEFLYFWSLWTNIVPALLPFSKYFWSGTGWILSCHWDLISRLALSCTTDHPVGLPCELIPFRISFDRFIDFGRPSFSLGDYRGDFKNIIQL